MKHNRKTLILLAIASVLIAFVGAFTIAHAQADPEDIEMSEEFADEHASCFSSTEDDECTVADTASEWIDLVETDRTFDAKLRHVIQAIDQLRLQGVSANQIEEAISGLQSATRRIGRIPSDCGWEPDSGYTDGCDALPDSRDAPWIVGAVRRLVIRGRVDRAELTRLIRAARGAL